LLWKEGNLAVTSSGRQVAPQVRREDLSEEQYQRVSNLFNVIKGLKAKASRKIDKEAA
jgi:hypothetical protein